VTAQLQLIKIIIIILATQLALKALKQMANITDVLSLTFTYSEQQPHLHSSSLFFFSIEFF
jgi:hypothetical protein